MPTIKAFIRTSTSSKNKKINIRFRLTEGRDVQLFHKSEIQVNPSDFDPKRERIKEKIVFDAKERRKINDEILNRKKLIESLFLDCKTKENINSKWLEETIDKHLHPEKYITEDIATPETLLSYVDKFIKQAPNRKDKKTGRSLVYNNIQQYRATRKHLKEFANYEHKNDYNFSEINHDFYIRFVDYLQKPIQAKNDKGKGVFKDDGSPLLIKPAFTQNSVGKHIRILKTMLNESTQKEADISKFHVFTEEVDNIYLDEDELKQLKEYDFSSTPHLDRVRDWFLLLAWTGSRFSDLEKISKSDIKDGFISFRQQKTNTKVVIPVHPVVLEILEKYNFNLPVAISNQRFNEYIKEVCCHAGIKSIETITRTIGGKLVTKKFEKWKFASTHTGRRSFCTNMYKRGLPTLMIMSISGHKSEKSFLKYIKVNQQEHAEMMAKKWSEIYK